MPYVSRAIWGKKYHSVFDWNYRWASGYPPLGPWNNCAGNMLLLDLGSRRYIDLTVNAFCSRLFIRWTWRCHWFLNFLTLLPPLCLTMAFAQMLRLGKCGQLIEGTEFSRQQMPKILYRRYSCNSYTPSISAGSVREVHDYLQWIQALFSRNLCKYQIAGLSFHVDMVDPKTSSLNVQHSLELLLAI